MTVTNGSRITRSHAGRTGGVGVISNGGWLVISNNSTIESAMALQDGGTFYLRGGFLTVTNHSRVLNTTAAGCGAFLTVIQKTATVSGDSIIANSGMSTATSKLWKAHSPFPAVL
eukprot:6141278-Prymnesium_polylepis.1